MQKHQAEIPEILLEKGQKVFFASDFHLGIRGARSSRERERQIVRWMDRIRPEAAALFLLGDLFDFWFEYRRVVPKGYVRLLGKIAEFTDAGIPVFLFTGNHDMWIFRYFEEELGVPTFRRPVRHIINGLEFFTGHGDGLGPGDTGYKLIKKVFANPLAQTLFGWLHPNFGIWLADYWSGKSRGLHKEAPPFLGPEKEWLIAYCHRKLKTGIAPDYFVFGHRHLPIEYDLANGKSRYVNLGDWLYFNSFGEFDGENLRIRFFETNEKAVSGKF